METTQIKEGDVVALISDLSTHMTVEKVDGNTVSTIWFDSRSYLQRGQFKANTLRVRSK